MIPQPTSTKALGQPPAPAGVAWISTGEAARRSGYSERQVRRWCGGKWLAEGLARLDQPADGGKSQWFVREDAERGFARVRQPESLPNGLDRMTAAQRTRAHARRRILDEWEAALAAAVVAGRRRADATADFLRTLNLTTGERVSPRSLQLWRDRYRRHGLDGLVDRRCRPDRTELRDDDDFLKELRRMYLDTRRPSLRRCVEDVTLVALERGWRVHSYWACVRYVKGLPARVRISGRLGPDAYNDKAQPYLERDYSGLASNDLWCSDHHQFDVIVNDGGRLCRPWLTAWQDMRSRKIVGWAIFANDPNQDTIIRAFRSAVLADGVPLEVYCDNGRDYRSYALTGQTRGERFRARRVSVKVDAAEVQGLFAELGVGKIHCQPYHGQSKPIERFFGSMEDRFGKTFDTYCGNKPDHKPPELAARLAKGKAPTLADFTALFGQWLEADYHARPHAGQGMGNQCPARAFAENLRQKRTASPELLTLLTHKRTKPVKVGRNGVVYKGIRYGACEPALFDKLGEEVVLRVDPEDLGQVTIWTTAGKLICLAATNRTLPVKANEQDLRAGQAEKARHKKALRAYMHAGPRMHEDTTDRMIRAALQRNAGNATPDPNLPPASMLPIRSEIGDQFEKLRESVEAEQLRPAVGAELLTFRQLMDGGVLTDHFAKPEQPEDAWATLQSVLNSDQPEDER